MKGTSAAQREPLDNFDDGDRLARLADAIGLSVVDRVELPQREGKLLPVPSSLAEPVGRLLCERLPAGVYAHQAEAMKLSLDGNDVCVATATASGKSLIFMAIAAHKLFQKSDARVLALYPARALIQDQIEKWRHTFKPLGFRIGVIDGGVPTAQRAEILEQSHVVLMTPDVLHAWMLSRLGESAIRRFLRRLSLVVLDEAHVYDGVFGTNMCYLMRRLDAAAADFRLIATTATLGQPGEFIERLTGRKVRTVGPEDDASPAPRRVVLLADGTARGSFQKTADLLKGIAKQGFGRFIAFGDSRRMVERMVVATLRRDDSDEDEPGDEIQSGEFGAGEILPYRAGYETEDRNDIQAALARGTLAGVVSTSALELGLDIGDIDIVVLLNPPASAKALWQRIGRTGRIRNGVCVLIDDRGGLVEHGSSLQKYLDRKVEPNWLYLDNRYLQYTNALCAAQEMRSSGRGVDSVQAFDSLPERFLEMIANELDPSEVVPDDLYPLKQRAQAGAHHEFPLRSDIEPNFKVKGPFDRSLGELSYGQVLREAYPGAVYYYMAKPHRVAVFNYRKQEIVARREKYLTTHPLAQTMVFPHFPGGILALRRSDNGFVAEAEVQVSERVIGFKEVRGKAEEQHLYGPESAYSQRDLTRFFPTTGVCWFLAEKQFVSERAARLILEAYCGSFGVQARDVGFGLFHANISPLDGERCQGMCIFDATHGSLRLTERLGEQFVEVLDSARTLAVSQGDVELGGTLGAMRDVVLAMESTDVSLASSSEQVTNDEWSLVVAKGSEAMLVTEARTAEVIVKDHRYSPRGLLYELEPEQSDVRWLVAARDVRPIYGKSRLVKLNLITGETKTGC